MIHVIKLYTIICYKFLLENSFSCNQTHISHPILDRMDLLVNFAFTDTLPVIELYCLLSWVILSRQGSIWLCKWETSVYLLQAIRLMPYLVRVENFTGAHLHDLMIDILGYKSPNRKVAIMDAMNLMMIIAVVMMLDDNTTNDNDNTRVTHCP